MALRGGLEGSEMGSLGGRGDVQIGSAASSVAECLRR